MKATRLSRQLVERGADDVLGDEVPAFDPEDADRGRHDVAVTVERERPEDAVRDLCPEELVDDRRPGPVRAGDRV
jgi:hypothetical protein